MSDARRRLPSVTALLESAALRPVLDRAPRTVVVDAIRRALDAARHDGATAAADDHAWAARVSAAVDQVMRPSLRPVINATGVVLHTNLGRAPLAQAAIDAVARVAAGYSNLEYDIAHGQRGTRYVHCAALLRELTGAEDAVVVNNGAAALVLVLNTLADGGAAIVSRGELVEIGGSFRIPEIIAKSGARLVEVGTTNRTRVDDYRRSLDRETGALLKVHRSNFAIEGFVSEAEVRELATLGRAHGVPVVHDLGSGLLISLAEFGLSGEPTAREALDAGASVVTMSGDKLAGGPQAGLVLGSRDIIERVRTNPLARSYRVDKLTLAALEATLALYRDPTRALGEIPALAMLSASVESLRARASAVRGALDPAAAERIEVVDSSASVGGGAFPTARIPSVAIAVRGSAAEIEHRLRAGDPPVVARVADGRVLLDLRTVAPGDDHRVIAALRAVVPLAARGSDA